jgi:hypothetical protein
MSNLFMKAHPSRMGGLAPIPFLGLVN